jgi:hypothetical protein
MKPQSGEQQQEHQEASALASDYVTNKPSAAVLERRIRWVEALESGKYEQGRKLLRSLDNKFCCLGVACDLFKDEVGLKWVKSHTSYTIDCNHGSLPYLVRGHLDFFCVDAAPYELAELNDNGASFTELAAVIREKLIDPYRQAADLNPVEQADQRNAPEAE